MTTPHRSESTWRPLGSVDPQSLVDARLETHHAAQIIVSAAISYVPRRDDDSHTNLEWLPVQGALATNVLDARREWRFALTVADLSLLSLESGAVASRFSLDGHSLDDGLRWLANILTAGGLDAERLTTEKHYEIPSHPVAAGAPYRARDGAALRELAAAYHDAWLLTSAVQSRTPGASDPRCWPHHFDLATLITLQKSSEGQTRTIGVGLSPGDDFYAEPYFYVTPYPYPTTESLSPLPVGHWHTKSWVGGALTMSELMAGSPDGQADRAQAFVEAAVVECRRALAGA